jgi:hypothetical protein
MHDIGIVSLEHVVLLELDGSVLTILTLELLVKAIHQLVAQQVHHKIVVFVMLDIMLMQLIRVKL